MTAVKRKAPGILNRAVKKRKASGEESSTPSYESVSEVLR